MKILYAEDEKALSAAVTEILRMEGHEVDPVYDGGQALEKALAGGYDAALLDIMMPELDGVSVLERMRQAQVFTPVLLLTAKAEVEDRISGLKAGADDYLAKPFDMRELLARIEAMQRRRDDYVVRSLSAGNVTLDCEKNEVSTQVGSLILSTRETDLLAHFLQNMEKDIGGDILYGVLGATEEGELAVRLYVTYLKNKLRQIRADIRIEEKDGFYRMVMR